MRSLFRGLVLGAALAFVALPAAEIASPTPARAETPDIRVGTELVALTNATLGKAEILKGSKVVVTKLLGGAGKVEGVAVALADGHVVKVALATVRSLFRIAD